MKAEKGTPLSYSHVRRLGDKKYLANKKYLVGAEVLMRKALLLNVFALLNSIKEELSLLSHTVRPCLYPQSLHGKSETQPEYTKLLISE